MDGVGDVGDVIVDGTAQCCVDVGIDTDVAFAVVVVECPVSAAVVNWKT